MGGKALLKKGEERMTVTQKGLLHLFLGDVHTSPCGVSPGVTRIGIYSGANCAERNTQQNRPGVNIALNTNGSSYMYHQVTNKRSYKRTCWKIGDVYKADENKITGDRELWKTKAGGITSSMQTIVEQRQLLPLKWILALAKILKPHIVNELSCFDK